MVAARFSTPHDAIFRMSKRDIGCTERLLSFDCVAECTPNSRHAVVVVMCGVDVLVLRSLGGYVVLAWRGLLRWWCVCLCRK